MTKRGKVLRDASATPGLLVVDGQQYPFSLEGIWKSEVPPKPGMVVDVELENGVVTSITAVPESQLAKEQAEVAMAMAKEKGSALASSMVAKFGMPTLVATGLLIIGWFFLTSVSVTTPFGGISFTFWQVLGLLNANNAFEALMQSGRGGPSAGFYGFLAIVCLAGPFVSHFWKDKRAHLGGLLPLLFMVMVGIMIRSSIMSSIGGGAAGGGDLGNMVKEMQDEAMKAISIGFGIYVSLLASLYLGGVALKKFLAAKASLEPSYQKPQKAAA